MAYPPARGLFFIMHHPPSPRLYPTPNTRADYSPAPGAFPSLRVLYPWCTVVEVLLSPPVATVLTIMGVYFCRVSEVLGIRSADVLPGDRVLVRGGKGSRSYVIFLPGVSAWLSLQKNSVCNSSICSCSYSLVYTQAKRSGIRSSVVSRRNDAVTHLARYMFASEAKSKLTSRQLSDCMHHLSVRSSRHYTGEEKA